MPYTIRENDGKYCVYKTSGGKTLGCHSTKDGAVKQIGAIESNEKRSKSAYVRAANLASYDVLDAPGLSFYVAESKEQRSSGLAGLAGLDKDGMVFVYEEDHNAPFTMRGMEFPIDIAFFDGDGRLLKAGTYPPGYSAPIVCPQPFRYVVESPAGRLDLSDIDIAGMWGKKGKKKNRKW